MEAGALGQVGLNVIIALFFNTESHVRRDDGSREGKSTQRDILVCARFKKIWTKVKPVMSRDICGVPSALSGSALPPHSMPTSPQNVARNLWTHTIIFCSHFLDDVEYFTEDEIEGESRASGTCAS